MSIRVTITKPGVTDAYGLPMVVGTTYTVDDAFGLSLIQQGRASDADYSLTSPGIGLGSPANVVYTNAAAIAAPTAQMLAAYNTDFVLDVAPFGRYRSNGTALVAVPTLNAAGTALVSGNGTLILNLSGAGSPTDLLAGTLQHVTITGAMSTTATQAAAATGTYYKARVAWNNNGASASAKLRIAVNCDNDVQGLMVGQSAKRRDYEMTMGDGVMLVCGIPITRLTFSADGSITANTHQLQVIFGN